MKTLYGLLAVLSLSLTACGNRSARPDAAQTLANASDGTVVLDGGYETDPRDGGRPVALIAAALEVEEQVFRDAFSGVNPSQSGPPSGSRARANKKVLMDALSPHGVTNERLDEVSDYYRYRPQGGELWKHSPAKAKAVVEDGKVTSIEIVDAGSGYLQAPKVHIAGHDDLEIVAKIEFTNDLATNGRLASLTLVQ